MQRSEIRNPKSETSPNSEIRNEPARLLPSGFGLRISFGSRISDFGFAALTALIALVFLSAAPANAAPGLTGDYYDNADFTTLKMTRVDPTVNFDWATSAPTNTMAADTFSVRWYGQLEPRYSETYTFIVAADDGARLWVNDRLIAARTVYSSAVPKLIGTIALQAGERVNLRLEFIENTGSARVKLSWTSPSQAEEVVPSSVLYPALVDPERGALLVEHWTSLAGTNLLTLTTNANYPNRPAGREFVTSFECLQTNWADSYGTRVTGYVIPPTNGTYFFAVAADDTAQLYLSTNSASSDKVLIASVPAATAFREFTKFSAQTSAPVVLTAGTKCYVELLHKEDTNADHFSVAWKPPGVANWTVIPAESLVPGGLDRTAPAQTNFLDTLATAHPRLFATPERFEWLRRTLAANSIPQLNTWWNTFSNSAAGMLTQPLNVYAPDERGTILDASRSVLDRMYKLSLVYRMNGDTNFAERAWLELQQVASTNFPDWHPAHFLDTAEMTHACAIGYDWLYDYWTASRRDTIRVAIQNKGLKPSLTLYTNNSSWVASSANNWNLVCNGGMILGALALGLDGEATNEFVLSKAVASASAVMKHYTTDNGGWYEGPGYWDYTTDYNIRLMAGLESALGSDLGLSDTRSIWETGAFAMGMVGPLKQSFNFADAGAGNMRGPQLFWMSRRYLRPEYAALERTNTTSAEALDLLWYDARGTNPAASDIPPDAYFRGPTGTTSFYTADALTLRSRWLDGDATFAGFKAGEVGASHGHLDAGTFVLDALGVRWAHDLGGDDYALPGYFGSQRWDYYRLRAEGHNTLVINPSANDDQIVGAKPPILLFSSAPAGDSSFAVADLTSAYGITKVWRGVQLLRNRRSFLVQDEIQAASPATVWWFMHINTSTSAAIDPDGKSVTLTQGVDRLWLTNLTGVGAFTLSNAVPLPTSPNPSGQNANANYRKLAVRLTGVTNTTLAVLMVPLALGQMPPLVMPTITPLVQWQIPQDAPPLAADGYFSTPQNTPLDVDLTTLASDAVTPSSNLVFAVSNAVNGTVSLLADGHTARFTPTASFYGTGQFLYTVTDSATNLATAGVAITVLPGKLYWDTSTAAGLQPASGTWDGATAAWSTNSTGSNPLFAWPALGNDAMFVGAGGSYTITINSTQKVNQITTTNGTWTVNGGALNHANGALTITANGDTTLNSPLSSATDFTKLGTNRLTLGAPISLPGDVFVPTGTLRSTASNALPVAASLTLGADNSAGALDFAASQTLSTLSVVTTNTAFTNAITVGAGQTLKIAGPVTVGVDNGSTSTTRMRMSGGGALLVTNATEDFTVGYSVAIANQTAYGNTASLDCSKLGSVTLGTTNAPLDELRVGYGNGTGGTTHTLTLSDTNNSIVATTVQVGNSTKNNGSAGTLMLGSGTNVIVTDTLNIGLCKVGGTVKFASQTAGSPGTLSISGKSGPATAIWVGFKNATGTASNPSSTLDLRGHNSTITASSLSIGIEDGSNTGGDSGSVYFDGGTFTVTNVTLGSKSGSSTGTANGSLYISGGTFTVHTGGSFTLGYQTNTSTATATLNLTGGTLNCQTDILDGGGSVTSTFTLNGGTLNLFGRKLGSATNINTLTFQSGTLMNVGEINAGAPLVKTGAGTLAIGGTNGFTGGTRVTAGTLQLAGTLASSLTVSNAVLTGSGTISNTLTFTSGSTFRPRINGYLPGTNYDQVAATGAITLAGALSVSVTNASALPTGYTFTIIRNNGTSPVSGTFAGLPQLATFTNAPLAWRINYQGADGNDVTLTLLSGGTLFPPTVVLTAPTNGATVGAPLTLTATASSPYGIAAVNFLSSALLLGSDSNSPYAWTQNQFVPGPHSFTAVARDLNGLSATSAPVSVNVAVALPPAPQLSGPVFVNGKPGIQVNGPTGYYYFVDASTNLAAWASLFTTNSPALPFTWTDNDTNSFLQRYYRVRLGP